MIRHRRVASNLLAPCLALLLRSSALTESPSEPLWVVDGARRAIVAPALGSGPTAEIATESGSLAFDHLLPIGTALERTAARPVGHGSLWVVDGLLIVDGIPVENGIVRIVLREERGFRVVLVSWFDARVPTDAAHVDGLSLDAARERARTRGTVFPPWGSARKVLYDPRTRGGSGPARWAWRLVGTDGTASEPARSRVAWIDAIDGCTLATEDGWNAIDVSGEVLGWVTPGFLPSSSAVPQLAPLRSIAVSGGGQTTFTDDDGLFVLDPGPGPVDIEITLSGRWCEVVDLAGAPLEGIETVLPPTTIDVVLGSSTSEYDRAQLDAYSHVTSTHDFWKSRQPAFTAIDDPLLVRVDGAGGCTAYYDGYAATPHIWLSREGLGCPNAAYASIVTHEYAHHILTRQGLPGGGPFGEGFADALAALRLGSPIIGPDWSGPGTFLRDVSQGTAEYPCFGGPYICGPVLSGIWWRLRGNLESELGALGPSIAQQLFTDWAQITIGADSGLFGDSATPMNLLEVLVADDDDGDLTNGTPHQNAICDAFGTFGIPCPGWGARFRRGDVNGDAAIDLADPIALLGYLFAGASLPPCLRAADADASLDVGITDAILILGAIFGGSALPPPFPDCGPSPPDPLSCTTSGCP